MDLSQKQELTQKQEFNFPQNMKLYRKVRNKEALQRRINYQASLHPKFEHLRYDVELSQGGLYLSAKCHQCNTRINYNKQGQHYSLKQKTSNKHIHEPQKVTVRRDQSNRKIMAMARQDIKKAENFNGVKQNYTGALSEFKYKKIKEFVLQQIKIEDFIQQFFGEYSLKFLREAAALKHNQKPLQLFLTSELMIQQFKKYGRCIYVYTSDSLEKQGKDIQNLKFIISCGQNCFGNMVIFAISVITEENVEAYQQILNRLFGLTQNIITQTIVSKKNQLLAEALENLSFEVQTIKHLIDPCAFVDQMELNQQKKKMVEHTIRAESQVQYVFRLADFKYKATGQQLKEIALFQKQSQHLCFYRIPQTFIHKPCKSPYKIFKHQLSQMVSTECDYFQFLRQILELSSTINKNSMHENNQKILFQDFQFNQQFQERFANQVLEQLYFQSKKACLFVIQEYNVYTIMDHLHRIFKVTLNKQQLRCNCGYKQKTLIPCSHMIFIAGSLGLNIIELVDPIYDLRLNQIQQVKQEEGDIQMRQIN